MLDCKKSVSGTSGAHGMWDMYNKVADETSLYICIIKKNVSLACMKILVQSWGMWRQGNDYLFPWSLAKKINDLVEVMERIHVSREFTIKKFV